MALHCAICGATDGKDGVVIEVVCHHCGKPLCARHAVQIIDRTFSATDGPLSRLAFHCTDCKRRFHPTAWPLREWNWRKRIAQAWRRLRRRPA